MATKTKGIRVGLLGESPNDTDAVRELLQRRYAGKVTCFPMLERLTGGTLDSAKILRSLPIACARRQPDVVVVVRDLDATESDHAQLRKRREYFERINSEVGGQALYLLHIYEFEALLLADVETFNLHYHSRLKAAGDPMQVADPKRVLQQATRQSKNGPYHENHSTELAAKLDYGRLVQRCRYFREFDEAFAGRLPN